MERFDLKESNGFKKCEISVDHSTLFRSMQRESKRAVLNNALILFCDPLVTNFSICVFQP